MKKGDYVILNKPYKICIHVEKMTQEYTKMKIAWFIWKDYGSFHTLRSCFIGFVISWKWCKCYLWFLLKGLPVTTEKCHIHSRPSTWLYITKEIRKYLFPNKPAMWILHWDMPVGSQAKCIQCRSVQGGRRQVGLLHRGQGVQWAQCEFVDKCKEVASGSQTQMD